jgi:hypothetical protein
MIESQYELDASIFEIAIVVIEALPEKGYSDAGIISSIFFYD